MESTYLTFLSLIVFLPAVGAILVAFLPSDKPDAVRLFTLGVTGIVLVMSLLMVMPGNQYSFDASVGTMQSTFNVPWIPSFDISYYMGLDGISFPLIVLTTVVSFLAMLASWSITKYVKGYCILFLLLETGMLGVFMALDFFLFYVFWEVMLLPMYFLIGVWGGPRKEYAAIKFFLYTLVGGVLMLVAMLMLYFGSDLRQLSPANVAWDELHLKDETLTELGVGVFRAEDRPNASFAVVRQGAASAEVLTVDFAASDTASTTAVYDATTQTITVFLASGKDTAADAVAAMGANPLLAGVAEGQLYGSSGDGQLTPTDKLEVQPFEASGPPIHTFNLLALAALGQHTDVFNRELLFGWSLGHWAFVLLLIGFVIKVPSVPVHTWLPDAHVEAPTPISMILAGVLLKMGGYGILRICYPICPHAGYDLAMFVCLLGVISMVYGAFAALAQTDFKRMVAYSSVSHMGYVVLGMGVWSATAGNLFDTTAWNMGIKGAMFQMIGHGISSAGMFFMVGVVYDRVHHRNLNEFGGLFGKMPVYTALAMGIFFAGLGLPGLCGFIGEFFVVLSVWKYSQVLAVIAAAVVVLTAGYILWAIQRVYLGAEYKGPHEEELRPINSRELGVAVPLFVLALLFGIFPYQMLLRYMDPTIDRQVNQLTRWTREVKEPQLMEAMAVTVEKQNPPSPNAVAKTAPQPEKIAKGVDSPDPAVAVAQEPKTNAGEQNLDVPEEDQDETAVAAESNLAASSE